MSDTDGRRDSSTWEEAVEWLRAQPGMEQLVRDSYFDDPAIAAAKRFHSSSEWAAVTKFIGHDGGTALDVGAGRGIASYALAVDGWTVTAVEPDSSNLVGSGSVRALSVAAGLNIDVRDEVGERLPFESDTFDLVYGRQVLHHLSDLNQSCAEFARVLRPGGLFVASREHVLARPSDLPSFLAAHPLHHRYGGEHAYLRSDYERAIANSGITVVAVLNPLHVVNMRERSDAQIGQFVRGRLPRVLRALARPSVVRLTMRPSVLRLAGNFVRTPGAPYTFLGRKVA